MCWQRYKNNTFKPHPHKLGRSVSVLLSCTFSYSYSRGRKICNLQTRTRTRCWWLTAVVMVGNEHVVVTLPYIQHILSRTIWIVPRQGCRTVRAVVQRIHYTTARAVHVQSRETSLFHGDSSSQGDTHADRYCLTKSLYSQILRHIPCYWHYPLPLLKRPRLRNTQVR